jgi:hypothetical protein
MIPPYPVRCYTRGCGSLATFKIAARWSDGITEELKTYALCCPDCLALWFRHSLQKQASCRRAPNEILEPPGIFEWVRGQRDRQLTRRLDLENQLTNPSA